MHFENLVIIVPFLFPWGTSDHGSPYWPTGVSLVLRKRAENRPLQGDAFAEPQKWWKLRIFTRTFRLGFCRKLLLHMFSSCLSPQSGTPTTYSFLAKFFGFFGKPSKKVWWFGCLFLYWKSSDIGADILSITPGPRFSRRLACLSLKDKFKSALGTREKTCTVTFARTNA